MKQLSLIIFAIALSTRCDQSFDYVPLTGVDQDQVDVLPFYTAKDQLDNAFTSSGEEDERVAELVQAMDPSDVDLTQAALDGNVLSPEYHATHHTPVVNNQQTHHTTAMYNKPTAYAPGQPQLPTSTDMFNEAIVKNAQKTFGINPNGVDPVENTLTELASVPADVARKYLNENVDPWIKEVQRRVDELVNYRNEQKEQFRQSLEQSVN